MKLTPALGYTFSGYAAEGEKARYQRTKGWRRRRRGGVAAKARAAARKAARRPGKGARRPRRRLAVRGKRYGRSPRWRWMVTRAGPSDNRITGVVRAREARHWFTQRPEGQW